MVIKYENLNPAQQEFIDRTVQEFARREGKAIDTKKLARYRNHLAKKVFGDAIDRGK